MPPFPAALDTLTNPGPAEQLGLSATAHSAQHGLANDAIEAIEAKLGTGASVPTAGTVLRGTGAGASAYGQIVSGDIADGTIATADLAANAATQVAAAVGVTTPATTTSASYADVPDMTVTLTTAGGPLLVLATGTFYNPTAANATLGFSLDGAAEVGESLTSLAAGSLAQTVTCLHLFTPVVAGSRQVRWRWKTGGGTLTAYPVLRRLIVVELRR